MPSGFGRPTSIFQGLPPGTAQAELPASEIVAAQAVLLAQAMPEGQIVISVAGL